MLRSNQTSSFPSVMSLLRPADPHRAQDELLLLLAHELRNPVHALSTALDVFDAAPPGSDTSDEAREVLRRQGSRLTGLMDELLAVGRVVTGRSPLMRAECDLSDLLGGVLAARPRARLRVAARAPAPVTGDPRWLRQALAAVLDRALQYAQDGLDLQLVAQEGDAVLALAGAGEPDPTGRQREGVPEPLDLQLVIASRLLELHGGELQQERNGPALRWQVVVPLAAHESTLPCVTPRPSFEPE